MQLSNDPDKVLNELLVSISDSLDITSSQYDEVIDRYNAIAEYLADAESPLYNYSPDIRPQGSFILGTMIKPIVDGTELDVDLVCRLKGKEELWTQKDVKEVVGKYLAESKVYAKMMKPEGNRCWTLQYDEQSKFHMDILPAVIEEAHLTVFQKSLDAIIDDQQLDTLSISITDIRLANYSKEQNTIHWLKSNPWGYAAWFKKRASLEFQKAVIINEAIEPIPIKSDNKDPLVRIVQILKRHRDIMFGDDEEKPISIIITTLAAQAYQKETDIFVGLRSILNRMPNFIEIDYDVRSGRNVSKVANPVIPTENFADKWLEGDRREKFYQWLEKAKSDFEYLSLPGNDNTIEYLSDSLGTRAVNEALQSMKATSSINEVKQTHAGISRRSRNAIQVAHKEEPPWRVALSFQISIHAHYKNPKNRKSITVSSKTIVPKDCEVFFIAETNVPKPFDVYWQVVNTGKDAEGAHDLRGEIFKAKTAGAGGLNQRETTKYSGTHWMECFIIKNGICVARSEEFWITVN